MEDNIHSTTEWVETNVHKCMQTYSCQAQTIGEKKNKKSEKKRVFFRYRGSAYTNRFSVMYAFYGREDENRSKFCPKLNELIPIFTPLPK